MSSRHSEVKFWVNLIFGLLRRDRLSIFNSVNAHYVVQCPVVHLFAFVKGFSAADILGRWSFL